MNVMTSVVGVGSSVFLGCRTFEGYDQVRWTLHQGVPIMVSFAPTSTRNGGPVKEVKFWKLRSQDVPFVKQLDLGKKTWGDK